MSDNFSKRLAAALSVVLKTKIKYYDKGKQGCAQINRNPQKQEIKQHYPALLLVLLLPLRRLKKVLTAETAYNTHLYQAERVVPSLSFSFIRLIFFPLFICYGEDSALGSAFGANCFRYNHAQANVSHIDTLQREREMSGRRQYVAERLGPRLHTGEEKQAKKINGRSRLLSHFKGQPTAAHMM